MIRVLDIIEDTMVDGPGFRTSIYCAGCNHQCPGCHNPQSWDFGGGREMTTAALMKIIMADPFANVTFSGGDPMYQAEGFAELARAIHTYTNKDIWCYTGFVYESIVEYTYKLIGVNLIDFGMHKKEYMEFRNYVYHYRNFRYIPQ